MEKLNAGNCDNDFCAQLPEHLRNDLCMRKTIIKAKRKRSFLFELDKTIIIKKGIVLPCLIQADGREKGLNLKASGNVIGLSQLFREKDIMFNIYAIDDFEGCVFPSSYFETLFDQDQGFAREIVKRLGKNLNSYSELTEKLLLSNGEEKVSTLLEMINSNYMFKGLNMTHEQMSVLLGINRVTVTKALSSILRQQPLEDTHDE